MHNGQPPGESPAEFMSIGEVAELTRRTIGGLYALRYRGSGPPSFRLGGRLVYRRGDVVAWIEGTLPPTST
jgi:predicted DNA-binding transcriptional regulator AlpA